MPPSVLEDLKRNNSNELQIVQRKPTTKAAKHSAAEQMRQGFKKLEKNDLAKAKECFLNCLSLLRDRLPLSVPSPSSTSPSPPLPSPPPPTTALSSLSVVSGLPSTTSGIVSSISQSSLRLCVMYIVLVNVLEGLTDPSMDVVGLAHVSNALSLLPILPRHRLICLRMSMEKNLAVSNFSSASRALKLLLDKNQLDRARLEELYTNCTQKNKGLDEHPPMGERFSYQTFKVITSKTYLECPLCSAAYDLPKDNCSACFNSKLIDKENTITI